MNREFKTEFTKIGTRLNKFDAQFEKADKRFEEIDARFEKMMDFLRVNMMTKQDLADLRMEMATKDDVNSLRTAVDGYAKLSKDYYGEVKVLSAKVDRVETWIKDVAAPKLGVDYNP